KLRKRFRRRGPAYGLRPVCCASIWYIGLPATAPATTAEGDAAAAGDAAGLAAGDAPGCGEAARAAAREADAPGATAGLVVGAVAAAGALVTVTGGGLPWQAANRPVPPNAANWPRCTRKRRRLKSIAAESSSPMRHTKKLVIDRTQGEYD